jgi:putative ABC transport system permease protein
MKVRVAMTAIGVIIGTAAIVVLVSLAAGLQRSVTGDLLNVGELTRITVWSRRPPPGQPGQAVALDEEALAEMARLPHVAAVTPHERLAGAATLRLNRLTGDASVRGIRADGLEAVGVPVAQGGGRIGRWQAAVGAGVAEGLYDPRTGQPVSEPPDLYGETLQLALSRTDESGRRMERTVRLRVTTVLEETGGGEDSAIYLSLRDLIELNSWLAGRRVDPAQEGYRQAYVRVSSPDRAGQVEEEVLRRGFGAYSPRSMLQSVNLIFLVVQGVFGGIGAIALIVAAFGIANTMMMSVYERTREIGLMKAVGATNRDVMSIFLAEATVIGLLGGVGGIALGMGLGAVINLVGGAYLMAQAVQASGAPTGVQLTLARTPLWLPIFALLFSALVGAASGIYPAVRATSLNPIAALKVE